MSGARAALDGDARYVFLRRVVTRSAIAELEDHDSVSPEGFRREKEAGAYALAWEAHGLNYGLRIELEADLAAGQIVVANGARRVIPMALERYPDLVVLLVTASPEVREARLTHRGREAVEDVKARLAYEGAPLPTGLQPIVIDNSESLQAGIAAMVEALEAIAAD